MAKLIKKFNVCVGKPYTTAQGEQKTHWVKIGSAGQFEDGSISLNIDALPIGQWNGKASLFEDVPKAQPTAQEPTSILATTQQYLGTNDEMPF